MADDSLDTEWAAALDEQQSPETTDTSNDTLSDQTDGLADNWASALEESGAIASENDQPKDAMTDVDWASALDEQRAEEQAISGSEPSETIITGRPAPKSTQSIPILLKIPLEISVVLGDTRMFINDLMQLGQGSIIELNKVAGADMDILVNGKYLGRGEVVVVNEHFGIRINHIASPEERIKSLGQG